VSENFTPNYIQKPLSRTDIPQNTVIYKFSRVGKLYIFFQAFPQINLTYQHITIIFLALFLLIENVYLILRSKRGVTMKKILLAGTLSGLLLSVQVASATPTFTFNHAAGMDASALAGFTQAGAIWSSLLTDNVNLSIDIGFSNLGAGILAQAGSASQNYTYSNVRSALVGDATSANDTTATSHLQSGSSLALLINRTGNSASGSNAVVFSPYLDNNGGANNTTIEMTTANAKALGLGVSGTQPDANITFSSTFTWDFNRSDGINATSYDFVGIAVHEIGHALGFISGVDVLDLYSSSTNGYYYDDVFTFVNPLDLFRYSTQSASIGSGVIDWTADTRTKYFSIDGGTSQFLNGQFSTGYFNGDGRQASHWKDNLNLGILDPTAATGELLNITQLDLAAMDVIGWDMVQPPSSDPVPEPSTLLLSGIGLAALGFYRRKRRS
jgi:hypothetical protein